MIARFWHTQIDPARVDEYDAFAASYSTPMFASLPGCVGALFLGAGESRSVLSLWVDRPSIDALANSPLYVQTVARLLATGILREPQKIELFEVTGGTLDASASLRMLSQGSE